MKRIFTMIALLALILGMVAAAEAWCRGRPAGWERGMGREAFHQPCRMIKSLNPTPEQLAQWKELKCSFSREILPLRNQLFSKRMELSALVARPDADFEAIRNKQKGLIALQGQMQEKVMDHQLTFRKTLTPEQLSKWIARWTSRAWLSGGPGFGMRKWHSPFVGPGMGPGYWNYFKPRDKGEGGFLIFSLVSPAFCDYST